MPSELENASFGELLRLHREKTVEKRIGKHLSQERLARKLSEKTGLVISRNNVNGWETNKKTISINDRRILVAIIAILYEYGGLISLDEADHLLRSGDYRSLNEKEITGLRLSRNPTNQGTFSLPTSQIPSQQSGIIQRGGISSDASSPRDAGNTNLAQPIELFPAECGSTPINLAQQRLLVSASFGAYFAGLLERPNIYLDLESQIDCPASRRQESLQPLQRIFWLLEYPKGPRIMVIGGEGGMGKSTLAARVIRCLYQEEAIDMILGDSAKRELLDPTSREIFQSNPRYFDPETFYEHMCNQLGLPTLSGKNAVNAIRDRLVGRKALIILDNLETVSRSNEILTSLKHITSRDIRAIVTTRRITGIGALGSDHFVVQLHPLAEPTIAGRFLYWHIEQYQHQHPALRELRSELDLHAEWLIRRTGGIPLLMQLVLSDVARFSWSYVETLPSLFGNALLDFLYRERWDDLGRHSEAGEAARQLLTWIAQEQQRGKFIASKDLTHWAAIHHLEDQLAGAVSLLFERFMLVNRNPLQGLFSIYPSLVEFINSQPA